MSDKINWELINDFEFVHLTADILRSLGFVNIKIQGDGPDGGLDLIATELVPFSIQGSQPLTWGIQCKFSKTGLKKSVNDSEIKDVEGILRSDRYSSHNLRGYMVVTNRKVVQNVVERLQGVDRSSPFRATYIDGVHLTHRLNDHTQIIDKYFGEFKKGIDISSVPIILSSAEPSFNYFIDIDILSLNSKNRISMKATLDISASHTVIPKRVVTSLEPQSVMLVQANTGFGTQVVELYKVNIQVGKVIFEEVSVIALEKQNALIGRNILKELSVLFDGPNGILKVWKI